MGTSSTKTTMKLLPRTTFLVITLFFTTIYSIPLQKASLEEEICDEDLISTDYQPALGVPDLVIDLRDIITDGPPLIVTTEEADCYDDVVTEEPEMKIATTESVEPLVTEECEDEDVTEALPEMVVTEETARGDMVADTTVCEDEDVIEEVAEFAMPVEPLVLEVEGTTECLETDQVIEELPAVYEMALPDADLIFDEECEY